MDRGGATHSLAHSLTHSLTRALTHSLTHILTHLSSFCINVYCVEEGQPLRKKVSSSLIEPTLLGYQTAFTRYGTSVCVCVCVSE